MDAEYFNIESRSIRFNSLLNQTNFSQNLIYPIASSRLRQDVHFYLLTRGTTKPEL